MVFVAGGLIVASSDARMAAIGILAGSVQMDASASTDFKGAILWEEYEFVPSNWTDVPEPTGTWTELR